MSRELLRDPSALESYARDVSGLRAVPEAVARPEDAGDVVEIVRMADAAEACLTPAGAQTSTTGASVAERGWLLSTRAMARILDIDPVRRVARVEPGVLIGDLQRACAGEGLFFAPDPTSEEECTVGGAIACNASGPRTLAYGATRRHVRALTAVLADGSVYQARRNDVEKNTVGYQIAHDPVDWFVGSEGTLGLIVEAELSLLPTPPRVLGLGVPFPDEPRALSFIVAARETPAVAPRCLEYFDAESFRIARTAMDDAHWAPSAGAMVYLEDAGAGDAPLDDWLALAERFDANAGDVRAFDGEHALREARRLRHALPAEMHERTAPFLPQGGRRMSTDWAVPYPLAAQALAEARRIADAHRLPPAVTYGHLGNGHPHQNFVAQDPRDVQRIERAVEETLHAIIAMGGTVAAEHGIGKIKSKWIPLQASARQLALMRALKREFDPRGRLSPGNIL
ncbi:MAG: FAD-binding oxidoreductase [Gemmatimonadetes bacterium]|nr:FAD-binding oxidoreductase [Gemmatimonadota bacterium]